MAEIRPEVLDAMAEAYQQSVSDIQIAAEFAVADAWYSLNSFAGEDESDWNAAFWAVVFGSSIAISGAARAYLEAQMAYTGIALPLPDVDMSWLESDFDNWVESPMVKARWAVGAGEGEAFAAGATRATKLVTAVTREAEQEAFRQMLDSYSFDLHWEYVEERDDVPFFPSSVTDLDREVANQKAQGRKMQKGKVQFKRIPQADACGWCRVVADRLYTVKSHDNHPTGSWHNFCRCTWRKTTPVERKSFAPQYDDMQWRTVIKERFDEQGTP